MYRFAVITVAYNADYLIRKTIESVLKQEYEDYEYWIIDGKSQDNTVEIARQYISDFSKKNIKFTIVSEIDNGIFNAMNKGVSKVDSKYVFFLNAGDFFSSNKILENVSLHCNDNYDIIYGNYYVYNNNKRKLIYSHDAKDITRQMICAHQAIFTKTSLLRDRQYDEGYKMAADYDFYLDMYIRGKSFKKIDDIIIYFERNGLSQTNAQITQKERISILYKHGCISKRQFAILKKSIWIMCLKKCFKSAALEMINYANYESFSVNL